MYVDVNTIITAGSLLTAVVVIFSAVFAVYKWYLRQNEQDKEIERMKSEQCLLTYGILACLKGLKEQGCNGPVTEAIDKIQKHINKQADISTLGTVVGIVAICYVIGLGCKAYEKIPDKWIPVIMAVCGGVLGVAGLYTMPDFPADDVINAVAVGMASGLAATGVNQLYKQQCK